MFAVAAAALLFTRSAHAQAFRTTDRFWNFEDAPDSGWFFGGNAGYDNNGCCSRSGTHNVWARSPVRNTWNSVNVEFTPGVHGWGGNTTTCDVDAWIQTGGINHNFSGGIVDVWNIEGGIGGSLGALLGEGYFSGNGAYHEYKATFDVSKSSGTVLLDFGFWGNGFDQWVQVDDVHVTCWNFNR
jgi:hypothetical protein